VAGWPGPRKGARRARILAAYLAIIALDVWLLAVLLDAQMGRGIGEALAAGTRTYIGYGLRLVALLAVAFVPALVLTMELVARTPPPSALGRALAGAVAWSAWGAMAAFSGASLTGLVFFQASVFAGLGVLALSGGILAALAFDRNTRPPGRGLIAVALAIVAVVVVGGFLTRGLWGGPT
jgi:hypothetical protein